MAEDLNINYTLYEFFYKKAKTAYISGKTEDAAQLFLSASDSLLKAAQCTSGMTKEQLTRRAHKLALLSETISTGSPEDNTAVTESAPEVRGTEKEMPDLEKLIAELNSLIGLESVKQQVKKRIAAIQVEKAAKDAGASRNLGHSSLHMVFSGNPGTGKTTVARLIGKIYGALGVIRNGDKFIETDRSGLIGKYVGHTSQLVSEKVNEALGGILFIDEAYSLYKQGDNDFGAEAISTLIKCMEDHRDDLVVILAGYPELMKDFIENANPGLESRFRTWINFEDYSLNELIDIFHLLLSQKGMSLSKEAELPLRRLMEIRSSAENFGNGRGVRNLLEDILEVNNNRLFDELNSGNAPDFEKIEASDVYDVLNKGAVANK